jgi:hypothetical protein
MKRNRSNDISVRVGDDGKSYELNFGCIEELYFNEIRVSNGMGGPDKLG